MHDWLRSSSDVSPRRRAPGRRLISLPGDGPNGPPRRSVRGMSPHGERIDPGGRSRCRQAAEGADDGPESVGGDRRASFGLIVMWATSCGDALVRTITTRGAKIARRWRQSGQNPYSLPWSGLT